MLESGAVLSAEDRKYTVIRLLGRGANTACYLAECKHGTLVTNCILKEFAPRDTADFARGKERFLNAGRMQNQIRQCAALNNQTPPVCHIFEANGTAYTDVACWQGTTLDRLENLSLPQYIAICRTIAKTVGYYHKSGFLCLDLKPENIFILQNAPDDTVTELVEFIDFDSVREAGANPALFSYTREWAAPEQLNPYASSGIGTAADIYTIGEIVFFLLFDRHSADTEHRGFSNYPFDACRNAYRKYTARPDVQALFTRFFRCTLRSAAANRCQSTDTLAALLQALTDALGQKDYVIPILPAVPAGFVGRDAELKQTAAHLRQSSTLCLTGIGGIGKTTLLKSYIAKYRTEYDVIVYLEFDGDFQHTFCDDMQLQISTVSPQDGETTDAYFSRKLKCLRRICSEKRVLFVLDNFSGRITKAMSRVIDCGYHTVIAMRNPPPKNSFACMELSAIADTAELFRLIALNLERPLNKEERLCFQEIITLVQGHTLVLELIARQIAAEQLDLHTALALIRQNGFSRFSAEKIGNYKDGEEIYGTLSAIITALFDAATVSDAQRQALKILSLLNVRGLESELIQIFFPDIAPNTVSALASEGWLYAERRIRLHPVIAEAVHNWAWNGDAVSVMEYHRKMTDIYAGMTNAAQISEILREAGRFADAHPTPLVSGIFYQMRACLFDTLAEGRYIAYTQEEAEILRQMFDAMDAAIAETARSDDSRSLPYLTQAYLSYAAILIRCAPDRFGEAKQLLRKIQGMMQKNTAHHCYYCMVSAWYYTLAEPDAAKTVALTEQAAQIAESVFPTNLEIVDIVCIPTANCLFYHGDLPAAAAQIEHAAALCRQHPDSLPYLDKLNALLHILLEISMHMGDKACCRTLIAEIDRMNERLQEHGFFRAIPPEIRKKADSV